MRQQESLTSIGGEPIAHFIQKYGLAVILIAFTLLALLYDINVPFFEKPDELKHFAVIQYIQTRQALPVVQAGVYKPWDQEGTQPPLYHLLAAVATSWLNIDDFQEPPRNPHYADERSFLWRERGNNNLYLHSVGEAWSLQPVFVAARLARWVSLLAGLGTVVLTYLLARVIFTETDLPAQHRESENKRLMYTAWLPLIAAALVAFVPQFLHTSSAITNDSLSVTLAAAALVLLALIIKNGGKIHYALYLGAILGLAALTKLSLLYLAPLAGLVLLGDWYRHRSWRRLIGYGAIIAGLMALLAGWWYGRNWQVYGDPTALNAHLLYRGGPLTPTPTLAQIWQTELTGLELSFWAAFGAGQILFDAWLYDILGWGKYIVFIGILIGMWGGIKCQVSSIRCQVSSVKCQGRETDYALRFTQDSISNTQFLTLMLLILWCLIIFVALLRWMQITPASWGRLLYPALPAMGVLAAWGLSQFRLPFWQHASFVKRMNSALTWSIPLIFVGVLLILAVTSPFIYLQTAYAKKPLISETMIPVEGIEHLDWVYEDAMRLIGYKVDRSSVQPGEWLPVTLYWQAVRPITKNYSVFIHLLGRENTVVGQVNTYPGGGNWPTSLLEPGKVLVDTYYVPVAIDAQTPAAIRLGIGIFEFEDPQRAAKVVVNPAGEVIEPVVGSVPLLPHRWPEFHPIYPMQVNFANQVQLVGYDGPAEAALKPGEVLPITFYWATLTPPGQNLNLFIHLVDINGTPVAGFDGPPPFATAFWLPGYKISDPRLLSIPSEIAPGDYKLVIGWYNLDTLARLPLADSTGDSFPLLRVSLEAKP